MTITKISIIQEKDAPEAPEFFSWMRSNFGDTNYVGRQREAMQKYMRDFKIIRMIFN